MPCEVLPPARGERSATIVCSRSRGPRLKCFVCEQLGATVLCDGPPQPGSRESTCSRPLHTSCSSGRVRAQGLDFCPPCWRARDPHWAAPKPETRPLFSEGS